MELISAGVDVVLTSPHVSEWVVHPRDSQDLFATTGRNRKKLEGTDVKASVHLYSSGRSQVRSANGALKRIPVSGQLDYPEHHALSGQLYALRIPRS
ncbi:MAG TPA: hypothetical protein PLY13_06270 [Methanoregulaceae archaeon]|nr:hypothetical protein [Methanoregulaceae archaeon]